MSKEYHFLFESSLKSQFSHSLHPELRFEFSERPESGRPVLAGHFPASLKIQTLILNAENVKIMILSYSQIGNDILSTSNNVDLHIFCFSSLKL